MAKEESTTSTEAIFAAPIPSGAQMRSVINQSLSSSSVNPIAAGNQAILSAKKRKILYKNGYTIAGMAAALLAAEATSGIDHGAKLGGNIRKAALKKNPNWTRLSETDAHHVVAATAAAAFFAQKIIFAVGIGINDRDNGVLLPRYKTTKVCEHAQGVAASTHSYRALLRKRRR